MQQVVVPKHYSAESEEDQRWRGRGEEDGSPGRSPGGKHVKGEIAWYVQTLTFLLKSLPVALAFSKMFPSGVLSPIKVAMRWKNGSKRLLKTHTKPKRP